MNKKELIAAVAEKTGATKVNAEAAINAVVEAISEELANGGEISLTGFGSFKVKERAARNGRNPLTGEAISIAASKAPVFKAGKALKEAVKNS